MFCSECTSSEVTLEDSFGFDFIGVEFFFDIVDFEGFGLTTSIGFSMGFFGISTGFFSEALTETSFNVYPNPASDLVNISFEGENTDYSISLMDIQGRVISSREIANASGEQVVSFSTENVAKGSYIVTVTSNGATTTKNVVIK